MCHIPDRPSFEVDQDCSPEWGKKWENIIKNTLILVMATSKTSYSARSLSILKIHHRKVNNSNFNMSSALLYGRFEIYLQFQIVWKQSYCHVWNIMNPEAKNKQPIDIAECLCIVGLKHLLDEVQIFLHARLLCARHWFWKKLNLKHVRAWHNNQFVMW